VNSSKTPEEKVANRLGVVGMEQLCGNDCRKPAKRRKEGHGVDEIRRPEARTAVKFNTMPAGGLESAVSAVAGEEVVPHPRWIRHNRVERAD
jgi:hypothetical protein